MKARSKNKPEEPKQERNYFKELVAAAEKLEEKGQAYLDTLDFIPNDEVCQRIWDRAKTIFSECGEDWNAIPEWVASVMDGCMPYTGMAHNGSLHYLLGYSAVSNDAHLRNLMEIAEGRTTQELDFPVVVPKDFLDR